jgi:hypothetical protein
VAKRLNHQAQNQLALAVLFAANCRRAVLTMTLWSGFDSTLRGGSRNDRRVVV